MGQPVSVIETRARTGGRVRFELNRVLTGMGHEVYVAGEPVEGDRPPDILARLIFDHGGIERIHVNGSVVTVTPERGADTSGLKKMIEDLYTYYRPGVHVPTAEEFMTEA